MWCSRIGDAPCPWCGQQPAINFGVGPRGYGVSIECNTHDCPVPDDAAIVAGWHYTPDEREAHERWAVAAAADIQRKLTDQ